MGLETLVVEKKVTKGNIFDSFTKEWGLEEMKNNPLDLIKNKREYAKGYNGNADWNIHIISKSSGIESSAIQVMTLSYNFSGEAAEVIKEIYEICLSQKRRIKNIGVVIQNKNQSKIYVGYLDPFQNRASEYSLELQIPKR